MSGDDAPPLRVRRGEKSAGGVEAVLSTARRTLRGPGFVRGLRTLSQLNQEQGFDCPGCAWPDPGDRSRAEFCENGAKAVAHETTRARVTPEFFAHWTIPQLREQSDYWLEQQGRLTHPMHKRPGSDRYERVSWEAACSRIAAVLNGLDSSDQAIFYTSGRTSNEAAFCISSSSGASAPTTSPTAPTCVTSPAARRSPR